MISNAMAGKPLPVYGDGQHVRDWVHVLDFCSAVLTVFEGGAVGQCYNVGGGNEMPNLAVVELILEFTAADRGLIRYVPDRPGHDRRYAMDHSKLTEELGWRPSRSFRDGLMQTVQWYQGHDDWSQQVRSGEYREYYEKQYATRLAGTAPGEER